VGLGLGWLGIAQSHEAQQVCENFWGLALKNWNSKNMEVSIAMRLPQ
jgi:hypothetical protein